MANKSAPATPVYYDTPVRWFALVAVLYGIVGMLVGVIIAAQLAWPELNLGISFLSYGRLRPLHTNAVIFAFGGCVLFATSYHVVQRTCQTALFLPKLAMATFWGWNLVIVLAVITLPLGLTSGKEYAELEWPIDLLIAVVWVSYAIVFFGTIGTRKIRHIYVANWFFGAFIIAVALLHIVNSAAIPVSLTKSYSAYAGVQDAMVQWWYGHNAVGFFLTAGFLGMMYYYIPKQAGRPVYSYRLSIVHFWALIFTYMWAGPHHLHYTALPDWAQSIGMIFSLVLLAPSWGGMINGIMTLSGAWHKLRDDPILKFLIVSLSFYGMSTFEGPMMSIKTVNALSHYTDWTVGHVHSGALGWVGLISMGCAVPPDSAHVRPQGDAQHTRHRVALLDRDDRHRAVHRRDVDCRRDAGPDVARGQPRRHAGLQLRRKREGDLSLLRDPPGRRPAVPDGMLIMGWNTVMTVLNGKAETTPIPLVAAHA
jgi:cytochrome c oxidase cbb3-type subunit 1